VFFRTDYDEINLKNTYDVIFGDVIVITSPKNAIKITSQNFPSWGPFQSKFLIKPVYTIHQRWYDLAVLEGLGSDPDSILQIKPIPFFNNFVMPVLDLTCNLVDADPIIL